MRYGYVRPDNLPEALRWLAQRGSETRVLAGGTDLMVQLRQKSGDLVIKSRVLKPGTLAGDGIGAGGGGGGTGEAQIWLMDISGLSELRGISEFVDRLEIGALATHTRISESILVRQRARALAEACASIGGPQIRNRGTIGGNIANASPAADTLPALVVLDAAAAVARWEDGRVKVRELPVAGLVTGPYQTALAPDELIVSVRIPLLPAEARSAYIKLGRRNAMSISRLAVAAWAVLADDGRVTDVRICPGSATPRPMRFSQAEKVLLGKLPSADLVVEAARTVGDAMVAVTGVRWSTEYKRPVVEALSRRAIAAVLGLGPAGSAGRRGSCCDGGDRDGLRRLDGGIERENGR